MQREFYNEFPAASKWTGPRVSDPERVKSIVAEVRPYPLKTMLLGPVRRASNFVSPGGWTAVVTHLWSAACRLADKIRERPMLHKIW